MVDTGPPTGVLLVNADDAEAVTLRKALSARRGLDMVAEVPTTREAIAAAEMLRPRVLVMAVGLDEVVGHGVLRSVRHVAPDTGVVLLSRADGVAEPTGTHPWIAQVVSVVLDPDRPASLVARLVLPGEPVSVPRARAFVTGLLDQWELDGLVPASELLVSELVANAVQHVVGQCAVELTCHADALRIAVSDSGPGTPDLQVMGTASERGRGLHIVSAFSTAWGVDHLQDGRKQVWAELDHAGVRT
jgi:anti-sigma regulatory factor (Ser/Thr protein kinase)